MDDSTNGAQSVPFDITDIENAVHIIDYACSQGAFTGWETIDKVRSVRDRLVALLEVAHPARQQAIPPETHVETPENLGAE